MSLIIEIQKYRPSNAGEGEAFMSQFCHQCARDDGGIGERVCEIIGDTMAYDVTDTEYPSAWIVRGNGFPCCTAFVPKDQPIPARDNATEDMFTTIYEAQRDAAERAISDELEKLGLIMPAAAKSAEPTGGAA